MVTRQDNVRFDRAHLKTLDQSFIEFEVVDYVLTPSYGDYMDIQQRVLLDVMAALDQHGIAISAPARDLVVSTDKLADKRAPWPLKTALLKKLNGT